MSFNEIVISTALRYITLGFSTPWIFRRRNEVRVGNWFLHKQHESRGSFLLLSAIWSCSVELKQRTLAVDVTAKNPLACIETVSSGWGWLANTQRAVSLGTLTTRSCPQVVDFVFSCVLSLPSPSLLPPTPALFSDKKASWSSASSPSSCKEFDNGDIVRMPSPDRPSSLPLSDPGLTTSGGGATLWQNKTREGMGGGGKHRNGCDAGW